MSRRYLAMLAIAMVFSVLCLALGLVLASEPGQQTCTAYWTDTSPVLDGVIASEEYSTAVPVYVTFNQPATQPGIVAEGGENPLDPAPDSPADLSFTIYATYDDENLYIAVDVADEVVINDGPTHMSGIEAPWYDDDVELFIDGDNVGNDFQLNRAGKEGFQLLMDVGGDALTIADEILPSTVTGFWQAASGLRPGGYAIEFAVSLSSIDTIDGEGAAPPLPGSSIGFNVTVSDDDNGGKPYNEGSGAVEPTDNYGAWDGNVYNWAHNREEDWGTLYFAPPEPAPVSHTSWGAIKGMLHK